MELQMRKGAKLPLSKPSSPSSAASRVDAVADHAGSSDRDGVITEYLRLLRRHRGPIFLCALAGLLLAALSTVNTRPLYRTRASIDVQGLNGDFMNIREVSRTGGAETSETAQQTQIKLLQSDTVLSRTVASLRKEPHPATITSSDALSRLLRPLHLPAGRPLSYEEAVEDTALRLKIKPLGITRLVELTCESWDPQVAAQFCNRLITEFENEDIDTRSQEAQKTSEWLTRQLADVRLKVTESQHKLESAVGGNGLMLSHETNSTGEERLRELQTELVRAQADRMQRESDSSVARTSSADTLPNVLDNPAYRQYQTRLADLNGKLAELVPGLTEENPKVIKLRAQIRDAQAGLAASQTTSSGRQGNELSAARHREELLQVAYNAQLATVSTDLQKAARVSLLQRELESETQLYQTMLQRAKEAGFASAMQASTMRVVDPAVPAKTPVSPRPVLSGIAGFFLGGLSGAGFFLWSDRAKRLLRLPGQVPQLLELTELGVIPHATRTPRSGLVVRSRAIRLTPDGTTASPVTGEAVAMTGWEQRFSIVAEAYRSTTFSILLSDPNRQSRTYVVTSPADGEGKTTVISNIGVALSRSRLRVLLIDGDMRKPRLHTAFGMRSDFGFRNLLRGEVDLETASLASMVVETTVPNLSIIPAGRGTEDTVQLLHSPNVDKLLRRLAPSFDIILIDTPPMLHMTDARVLSERSDGSILIFRAGVTTFDQAQAARDLLDRDGIHIVGAVLNDFHPETEGLSQYYSSYERYQSGQEATPENSVA